jgi:hypothetical protein
MNTMTHIPEAAPLLEDANHVDVKSATGPISLRAFIAGVFSYQPGWVTFLYGIRWGFLRLLGLKQEGIPHTHRARPEDVPMTPGGTFEFLTVQAAQDDQYWIGRFDEKHLTGHVVVTAEPVDDQTRRFRLMTIVHYNTWAGPIYFNVIKPFHHLVVRLAVNSAVRNDHTDY